MANLFSRSNKPDVPSPRFDWRFHSGMPSVPHVHLRVRWLGLMLACTCATPGHAADDPQTSKRFTGNGALQAADQVSADRRFTLQAELQRGDATQRSPRFELTAQLDPSASAKAAAAACGPLPDDVFRNGFE